MPELIGTLSWEGSRVDIIQRFGRQTVWVTVDGQFAALVHTSRTVIHPHNGRRLPDEVQSRIVRLAATAQTNRIRVCPDIEPTGPPEPSDHDRESIKPAGCDVEAVQ
ncbi:hypothetical protein [Haloglycomyces albus]|uniref:hypothetical protein n=1 Tax=Haloglycomyces albus TaxID=526067 RepID=UPI00046D304A|nr:hypothetical protein [Haloglycomyces albus]